jgi:hypothetical protein
MAQRTVLQGVVACLRAAPLITSRVGNRIYLGAAPPTSAPPLITLEVIKEPYTPRTGTDTHKVWTEAPQLLVKCADTTGDGADLLASYVKDLLVEIGDNATFDVTDTKVSLSLRDDYALTIDPERAPDTSPVYVGVILHTITVTKWKER